MRSNTVAHRAGLGDPDPLGLHNILTDLLPRTADAPVGYAWLSLSSDAAELGEWEKPGRQRSSHQDRNGACLTPHAGGTREAALRRSACTSPRLVRRLAE
ncbi:hypothetical protein GCM10022288_25030 [Gryllotalpicola kribbensis]|uniref:Uncharacterized protein n=1 Tax=Gryllotalpicola kribbensis TaxID=993084 RepID=A0ABP8AXG6_9MICO